MSFRHHNRPSQWVRPDADVAAIRAFFEEHGSALRNAAGLLGGPSAEQRCLSLQAAVRSAVSLTRPLRLQLVELHRLLTLENVGDPERDETALFSALSPADPIVHDLCLLADRLEALLVNLGDATAEPATPLPVRHAA